MRTDSRDAVSRRSFLAAAGAAVGATAGCVSTGVEPRGRELDVKWRIDPESTGDYEHIVTRRDERREWTWFEGKFVALDPGVVGFEHAITFYHGGDVLDRWRGDFLPGEESSLFVMEPGEFSTYEYALKAGPVPTLFEVLVEQVKEE